MLGQQRQCLLTVPIGLQHCASKNLYGGIFGVILGEVLSELEGGVAVASGLLRQSLGGGEVGGIIFGRNGGNDLLGLTKGNLGAELEHTGWELVLGGEGGGVEVDHGLVLAGVEGIVDVEELWEGYLAV